MTTQTRWRVYAGQTFLGIASTIHDAYARFHRYRWERKQAGETISPYCYRLVPTKAVVVHEGWRAAADD